MEDFMSDGEHPIGQHTALLQTHDERIANLEAKVNALEKDMVEQKTHSATIFTMLEKIEIMLKEYTVEMKTAIQNLGTEIMNVKLRPGRYMDKIVMALIAAGAGALVMFIFDGVSK